MKTSRQSPSLSPEAGKFAPNLPLDGKLFDLFASLLQLAELHGGCVLKSIASDFNAALLRYQNNRTCDRAPDFFINLKQQCQRMMRLPFISDEVRKIFQEYLAYIEQQVTNDNIERKKQTKVTYDEEIFDSYD